MGVAPLVWLGAIDPAVQAALAPVAAMASRWWANDGANDWANDWVNDNDGGVLAWGPSLLAQAFQAAATADYMRILPELVLSIFGMLVMVVDPLLDEENSHRSLGTIALIGTLARAGFDDLDGALSRHCILEHGAGGRLSASSFTSS